MRKTTQTSFNFQEQSGEEKLTSSQQASPASRLATQEREKAVKTTVSSGRKILEYSERLNQDGSFARTFRGLLLLNQDWYSSKCALTWKMKATKYNRLLFQLVPKMRFTGETEFGLLPTTKACDGIVRHSKNMAEKKFNNGGDVDLSIALMMLPTLTASETYLRSNLKSTQQKEGSMHSVNLSNVLQMLPTPKASDNRDRGSIEDNAIQRRMQIGKSIELSMVVNSKNRGLKLQPAFAAWMMNLPEDWTLLPFQKANGEQNP